MVSGVLFILYLIFDRNSTLANSGDPDQMPHFAASGLGLCCLPKSQIRDARHEWVKETTEHFGK